MLLVSKQHSTKLRFGEDIFNFRLAGNIFREERANKSAAAASLSEDPASLETSVARAANEALTYLRGDAHLTSTLIFDVFGPPPIAT